VTPDFKRCPDCEQLLPQEAFRRNSRNADGLSAYCAACYRRRDAEAYRRRRAALGKTVTPRIDVPGHKRCADCREVKPLGEFDRARSQSGGRNCYCKPCRRRRERDARFLREYGLTAESLQALVDAQDGQCAICRERSAVHVDHDHLTGAVRGVLCFQCNAALGQFRDRPDILRTAIDYLERTTWTRQRVDTGVYRLTSPRPAARPSASSSELQHLISSRRG
jgi:hypothetical protein